MSCSVLHVPKRTAIASRLQVQKYDNVRFRVLHVHNCLCYIVIMVEKEYVSQWKLGRVPKEMADKFDALARRRFRREGGKKHVGRTEAAVRLFEWFVEQPEVVQQAIFDQLPELKGEDIREEMIRSLTDSIIRSYETSRKDTEGTGAAERG